MPEPPCRRPIGFYRIEPPLSGSRGQSSRATFPARIGPGASAMADRRAPAGLVQARMDTMEYRAGCSWCGSAGAGRHDPIPAEIRVVQPIPYG